MARLLAVQGIREMTAEHGECVALRVHVHHAAEDELGPCDIKRRQGGRKYQTTGFVDHEVTHRRTHHCEGTDRRKCLAERTDYDIDVCDSIGQCDKS